MATIDPDALTGRDLDAAVAEHVLGWKRTPVSKDYDGLNECEILTPQGRIPDGYQLPPKGRLHLAWLCPEWHRNLDDAIRLAQSHGRQSVEIPGSLGDMPTLIARSILAAALSKSAPPQ